MPLSTGRNWHTKVRKHAKEFKKTLEVLTSLFIAVREFLRTLTSTQRMLILWMFATGGALLAGLRFLLGLYHGFGP